MWLDLLEVELEEVDGIEVNPDQLIGLLMLMADLRLQIAAQATEIARLQAELANQATSPG